MPTNSPSRFFIRKLKNNLLIYIVFFTFSIAFLFASSHAKNEEISFPLLYYDEAVKYQKQGDFNNAILYLNNALKIYPDDLASLINQGEVYIEQSKPEQAIKPLKRAISISPEDAQIHVLLGTAFLENKQYNDALTQFKLAERLEPDNILLKANVGLACSLISDYKCAVDNLGKVVIAYPFQLRSRAVLGTAYHSIKDFGLAKEQYKFVLEYDPGNITLWYNLAKTQIALSEFEDAKQSIDKAILLDGSVIDFYLDKAQIDFKLNNLKEAEVDYLKAIEIDPVNPEVPVEYAVFLWKSGDYLKSAEQFHKAHDLSQDDKSLIVNQAYMYQLAKKEDEALKTWLTVLENEHNNPIALFNIARLYQDKEDYEKAISFYKKLLSSNELKSEKKDDLEAKSGLAYCYQKTKDFSSAKSIHESILESEPDDLTTIYNLGVLYLEEKEYKIAINYLEKAIKNGFTPLGKAYQSLVEAYTNTNDRSNLKSTYKNWLAVDKNNVNARITYAKFLAKEGDSLGAIDQYRVAVALDDSSSSKLKLAEFLVEQKDLYGAIGQLQEYLKLEPNNLNALVLLANVFKDLGIQEQAINTYKKIIAFQYDNNLAYYNLGLLYQQDKKYEEAQNYLLKSIEINDKYAPAYYALGISFLTSSQKDQAREYFQKYLQVDPNGEYKEKVEGKLKDLNEQALTSAPPA